MTIPPLTSSTQTTDQCNSSSSTTKIKKKKDELDTLKSMCDDAGIDKNDDEMRACAMIRLTIMKDQLFPKS